MSERVATKAQPAPAIRQARTSVVLRRKCACGAHTIAGGECGSCRTKHAGRLQRSAFGRADAIEAPSIVHDVLRSPGCPLDAATRSFMEPRFDHDFSRVRATSPQRSTGGLEIGQPGDRFEQEADQFSQKLMREPKTDARGGAEPARLHDFSGIRIHTDAKAAESAHAVNALAYTVGNHLVFGAGQYAPETDAGKQLLAHELTHAIQQGGSHASVQRACDPMTPPLSVRTNPVFFPKERTLRQIFRGSKTLKESAATPSEAAAVGLVQQALVDLGFNLGKTGPNKDGVDSLYGPPTTAAVKAFQTAEAVPGAASGEVDQPTFKCLDEQRAHVAVAPSLKPKVTPADVQVKDRQIGGRDEEVLFDRGSSTVDVGGKAKITRLLANPAVSLKGCPITLEGYVSEDELVEFSPSLAEDRINAVSAEFAAQGHDNPGPVCTKPARALRTPSPLPGKGARSSDYRAWRKVEVARAGSTAAVCAPFHPPTSAESKVVKEAVKLGVEWMDAAIGKLTPGNKAGDAALTAYFGGTGRRDALKSNLVTWRAHLKNVVPARSLFATDCNDSCRTAIASNEGVGSDAEMTVCRSFFGPLAAHPTLNADQNRSFIIMHEAGHGSISTSDTAYGHGLLIEFLADDPAIAEGNTDSYTLMVLCLNGFSGYCAPPKTANTATGMTAAEKTNARRGLSWLQTWLIWAQGATSNLYGELNDARKGGDRLSDVSLVAAGTFQQLAKAFNLRRPEGDPPPTFAEQTFVAAVLDRLLTMMYATFNWPEFEKETGPTGKDRWSNGPGRKVFLTDAYFELPNDRRRVECLLTLIIHADARVSTALEKNYETYIKETVKSVGSDKP